MTNYYDTTAPKVICEALTTGNSNWIDMPSGGTFNITTGGTYGGATVSFEVRLQAKPSQSAVTLDSKGELYTSQPCSFTVTLSDKHEIRLLTTGGGGSQSINAYITRVA